MQRRQGGWHWLRCHPNQPSKADLGWSRVEQQYFTRANAALPGRTTSQTQPFSSACRCGCSRLRWCGISCRLFMHTCQGRKGLLESNINQWVVASAGWTHQQPGSVVVVHRCVELQVCTQVHAASWSGSWLGQSPCWHPNIMTSAFYLHWWQQIHSLATIMSAAWMHVNPSKQ